MDYNVPPPGFFFRIVNAKSKKALQSRESGERVGVVNDRDTDDMYWELIRHPMNDGVCRIKNRDTGFYITVCKEYDPIGDLFRDEIRVVRMKPYNEDWTVQSWIFNESSKYPNTYWIRDVGIYKSIYGEYDGCDDLCIADLHEEHKENCWEFIYENMEIVNVEYKNLDNTKFSTKPNQMWQETLRNDTSVSQKIGFKYTARKTNTTKFSHEHGISVKTISDIKFGAPFIGAAGIRLELSYTNKFTFGTEETTTEERVFDVPIDCKPFTHIEATVTVNESTINVPYTMTLKSKTSGKTTTSSGTFTGVNHWNFDVTFKEIKDGVSGDAFLKLVEK